jgi:hypothetical protein
MLSPQGSTKVAPQPLCSVRLAANGVTLVMAGEQGAAQPATASNGSSEIPWSARVDLVIFPSTDLSDNSV